MKISKLLVLNFLLLSLSVSAQTDSADGPGNGSVSGAMANVHSTLKNFAFEVISQDDSEGEVQLSYEFQYRKDVSIGLKTTTRDKAKIDVQAALDALNNSNGNEFKSCKKLIQPTIGNSGEGLSIKPNYVFVGDLPNCNKDFCLFKSQILDEKYTCGLKVVADDKIIRTTTYERELANSYFGVVDKVKDKIQCESILKAVAKENPGTLVVSDFVSALYGDMRRIYTVSTCYIRTIELF